MKIVDRKEFYKQLEEFKNSPKPEYLQNIELKEKKYLIEVFKYKSGGKSKSGVIVPKKQGQLLDKFGNLTSGATASTMDANEVINSHATHIARILDVGDFGENGSTYEVGDIIMLPFNKVVGTKKNPDWLYILQFSRTAGETPIMPPGLEEDIDAIAVSFGDLAFIPPHSIFTMRQDISTYAIPEYEIVCKVSV